MGGQGALMAGKTIGKTMARKSVGKRPAVSSISGALTGKAKKIKQRFGTEQLGFPEGEDFVSQVGDIPNTNKKKPTIFLMGEQP
jgi:hypothetical protein